MIQGNKYVHEWIGPGNIFFPIRIWSFGSGATCSSRRLLHVEITGPMLIFGQDSMEILVDGFKYGDSAI